MFQLIFCVFQLQKLESDITPLQQANSELSEKSGMLQAEKKILEEEIKRWKARTQVSEQTRKEIKALVMLGGHAYVIRKLDCLASFKNFLRKLMIFYIYIYFIF